MCRLIPTEHLRQLLELLDPELAAHVKNIDEGYLVFCHRSASMLRN